MSYVKDEEVCKKCSGKIACDTCENFVWDVFDIYYHTWRKE